MNTPQRPAGNGWARPQMSQGDFLRDAMRRLNLTPDEFCSRFSIGTKTLTNWLLNENTKSFRNMPEIAWRFIAEVVERDEQNA